MALGATMFRFLLDVSDVDRGVYTSDELVIARHPSETDAYMITRILAWALEYDERIVMGRGLAFPEEPTLSVPDDMGGTRLWIEVGAPTAERVHRAAKQAERVCIYTHREIHLVLAALNGKRIHNADRLTVVEIPASFMKEAERVLTRRNTWSIVRNEGLVYLTAGSEMLELTPVVHSLGE
jgi:uncharacterized protein YaeQ